MATYPPGPRWPRAVQRLAWALRPVSLMERCSRRYGDMFTLEIGPAGRSVFVSDPQTIQEVFTEDSSLLRTGEANTALAPIMGSRSVFMLDDTEHLEQRKLLLPPFHGEYLKRYREQITELARAEIATWPDGQPLQAWPRMRALTLEVMVRVVFGVRDAERLGRLRTLLTQLLDESTRRRPLLFLALPRGVRMPPRASFRRGLRDVHDLLIEEIASRRVDPILERRDDVLSILLRARHEDGSPMTDVELRDELMTLLVAGHETYLEAVVKEVLRLRPVLPIVVRRLSRDAEIGGRLLPKGALVTPCIFLLHRRPQTYPNPRAFRPERFLEAAPPSYAWIPFGGGRRRCIGASFATLEMRAVLSVLLTELQLDPVEPEPERVKRRGIVLAPSGGALVNVSPATNAPEAPLETCPSPP